MPHKRAKRSIRERTKTERKLDLPPSESTFAQNDIPKSMARVLNAEIVQNAWREKKRALDSETGGVESGSKRKKRKTEGGGTEKAEIKIKPGESLRHFKRRVEDDMRPLVRSAMKNATSVSKQKSKQSQKDVEAITKSSASKSKQGRADDNADSDSEDTSTHRRKGKGRQNRSPSPDFARISSSMPKRLNDVAQAPPELKAAPRLNRLVRKAQAGKSGGMNGREDNVEDDGIITLQQKRMMELEREKAINRYRALKEAKLKERHTDTKVPS
ncbi:uncharacterized protein FOMMEDRAFT_107879 [Fomitiporia mediterranea MF3/22]|uniref:uncharacterized protein n=1 Tax=Fomitiporia mediterranea (strain MF3/22) TaxID=694068 RepID=UPI00044091E3|nr:uncharacterized protein FOMMEDRAFT_107879 [Fomitiporia mediterranea MF3/22]EJD02864.1 hypothetical protein FOMMEDRAFT_107879 [Fomitiporia mediterranea MF3/22]